MEVWYYNRYKMKLFENFKVIELASVLAGPSVGMFFAELGAKVIKVENKKTSGDVTRSWKLASEDLKHPFSAYYCSVNYGKESIFLDLTVEKDYQKVLEFIADADLVVANFKFGDAKKMKLDFESLKAINSTIIYGEITGFGTEKRIAYDVVLQAETGFLSMSGTVAGELCKMPVALIDLLAAHQLKEGILLALLSQQKKMQALKVSVSLFDAALASLANQATNWLVGGKVAKPMGTLHPNIAPYGELFNSKDNKRLVLAIGSNSQFKKLCETLGLNKLARHEKFISNQKRVLNRLELADILNVEFLKFDRKEILSQLIFANVPAGAVRSINEVFELNESQKRILVEEKEGQILKTVSANAFEISA